MFTIQQLPPSFARVSGLCSVTSVTVEYVPTRYVQTVGVTNEEAFSRDRVALIRGWPNFFRNALEEAKTYSFEWNEADKKIYVDDAVEEDNE